MANKKLEVNVQHIIKDIEAGKFTSFQSILNETGGQHIYEAVNEELRKYLKENNAVMISATQLAHLRETGYKDFESERKALETQLKSATGDLKKQIENKLKDLKKFQYYSERKAPIGDELHKILELTDKGLVDLNDAVKAANQIMQQMQIDPHTNEKLKSLVGKTSTDTMKNFRRAIKNAQDFQKMKISAGMVGGETETARSMAFKKDGKLYVVSGSTDWTKAKEGKIGDYKTTASFSAMHNLIQSVVNATLIRAQEGTNLPITSKVAHLPINTGRMKYANTLPGVYDINVGSYQEGVKLISDLIDVLEGRKSFTDVKIPGSVQGVAEKGPFTYKNEVREAMYYNGKPIGQWIGQTVEEVKSLLDSLQPQQRQQFLGSLFGQTDGKPWYNTENAKLLKEAFRNIYQPVQKDFKTYGGMSLSTLSSKFASGEITKEALINAIKEGTKTQDDAKELASRLFYGEDKYYQASFVKAVRESGIFGGTESPDYKRKLELEKEFADLTAKKEEIEASVRLSDTNKYTQEQSRLYNEVQKQMQDIAEKIEKVSFVTGKDIFEELGSEFLEKMEVGYLSGLSEDEKPKPNKYEMYAPDVWELEEKKQQAWIESGVERMKFGYTDKPLFDDKGIRTLADRMTRLVDFYQRTTNIFNKVAEDINKNLPADTEPYTGEELARTYLARKSPEVYDRYMRSKGLYEGFTSQAQGLPLEEQVQWIRKQLDTFIAEEGNLLNTFDTFTEIADQKSKNVFSKEFARKIGYVGAPGGYVAPGTLYGLLMGSTFGVAQESQMPEFDKQRRKDIYGRTLSAEAIDRLTESQVDDDISKIDFYKQKLAEMTDVLGVSSEKIGIFSDYLDKVQKVADQAGIELEQVLEGVDEQGFIKEGSLLDKQLRAINEAPVESLYLPTSGKHGIGSKARESLFGLFDDTGMESLATQYDIYLDEQDTKRKEELKKQNDIRVQKEQEFTKLIDTELENRLKFLYAETAKPDYIKAQEAAERNEDTMGLSPEMFKGISGEGQKGLSIGSATEKAVEETEKVNEANEQLAETIKEETELKRQSIEQIKTSGSIQDVRKRGKIDNDYDKWTVDRVVKNELGEVTDTIYKKARKSSGSRGPSGISQVVEKVIPAVENINNNIDEINKKIPSSFKDIDWESFQKMYDKMEVSSDGGAGGDGGGKKPPKSGGRKGKSDEEKAQADTEKQQKQDIREYQQYVNKVISLESQIDKLQRQATLSGGKHKDAIYGTIDALNEELGDLNRNNDALKQRVATEQAATKESIDATAALKKQSNAQKNLVSVKGATSIWDMMANDIRRATMRVADFGIAAKLLNKIPQDIQKVIQYTKELDAAMTNIRVVTGATAEEAQTLARGYTQLAKELGVTTVEVANSANEWARQGYEAEEANQLIVASSKLAKLGMISTTEATKDLTSAIKGFKLSTEDAMSVVDKLTKIDQVAAISAGNLAEGLARVSTTAQQAGLSLDETAAMVTTITEVTQRDASTAGEALRTLISRYSNVKAGVFTSMGEEAEETSGNINDIEKVLGKLGIRIRTSGTEMRSIEDVLDELAEKWDTLDDVSRNAVASVFAGVRQRESFNILLSNWDRVKELTEESANAAGTANEKYSAYMDSMEAATKRLQNAWEGFTQSFETSTVMKSITNAAAFLVENTDKLKYLVTYIAAAGSARIFDFFTNKGETGGFKGLIANIPFIGRGTKTNNILESIDKKVGNIEKGVGVGSIANQTKNGGLFKRLGRFLKTGFGFGDIYDPETGKSISYNSLKTQKLFKINTPQQKEFEKLLKQRKGQNAAMGAVSAVLTNILTKKQVGGDIGGSLMKNIMGMGNNEQIAEETALDKTVRVSFSGGLAAAGGALLGPLGAMLGQTLGEGFASMFSTWYHRDELEMKQQVADAKSKDKQLASIKESIDSVSLDLGSKTEDYETYQKRKKEVDALRDKIGNSDDAVKASINAAAISKGYKGGYDEILNSLLDTSLPSSRRESIKNDLLYIISSEKAKNYKNTQLIELEKLNKAKAAAENQYAGGFEWFENANLWDSATIAALFDSGAFQNALQKAKDLGYITKESFAKADAFSGGKWDLRAVGDTADERIANYAKFRDILKEIGEIGYFDMGGYQFDGDIFGAIQSGLATAINFGSKNRLLQDIISGLDNMITNYNQGPKLQSEWQSNFALAGIYGSGLNLMKPSKLKELGLEGSIQEIADFLENNFSEAGLVVRDETGKIIESVHDDIKKAIKDDETLYNNLIFPQTSIKEWQQNSEKLLNIIDKLGMKTESELAAAAEKGGKEFLDLAKSVGLTTTELRSLLNLGSEDYLSKMAQSINLTKEQLLGFAKSVKGLDRVALSAFTLSSSQLTEKFDLMREAYSAAIDGSWAGNSEILNKINSDNFIKGFITNINDASQTAKELGEILYTSGQSLEEFLQGFALFSDIMTSGSQMENFVNYLKETNPELKSIVIDMNNIKEVLDYIANNPDNTKLKGALEQFIQLQEIQKYNEALDKSIQAVIKSNEKQIENLTQQKEALGSINDERKKELEYIKAKDALENARKEKKRVYRVGVGWSYESDDNAIAEAVEKIETLDVEKQQNLLQTQIDQLEQQNKILENLPNEKELEELKKILKDLTGATTINSGVVGTLVDMYNNPNYSFNSKDYIDNYIKAQKSKNYQEMFNFVKDKNLMRGDYARWDQVFGTYGVLDKWNSLTDEEKEAIRQQANTRAVGDISFQGGKALINELGTEAVITPGGTLTALPSKTGIVPADITRNVWALGEVAPTLVAQLGSLTQKTLSGNGGNTTYEEGQYFDNFTMNVYPAKGDDFNKILEQARAQMRLTRHNN